jgi:hypothetical protein
LLVGEALLLCGASPAAVGTPASSALVQLSVKIFAALNTKCAAAHFVFVVIIVERFWLCLRLSTGFGPL